jgi:hypothetical protein
MNILQPCPLWGGGRVTDQLSDSIGIDNIRAGGAYEITRPAIAMIAQKRTVALAAKLTTWIINQHRSGVLRPVIDTDVVDRVEKQPRLNVAEQLNRFFEMLLFLGARADFLLKLTGGDDEKIRNDVPMLASWLECETDQERRGLQALLYQSEFVAGHINGELRLTPAGIFRLVELQRSGIASWQAFVAIWPDPSMDDAFANGFEMAIAAAGYSCLRLRKKQHNGLDDETVAEIRKSTFVVADLTSEVVGAGEDKKSIPNAAGYFAAGFALGLGLPVIWCCRSDRIAHVDFNSRQFSPVVWDNPEDLAEKLYQRICALIGQTSNAPGLPK